MIVVEMMRRALVLLCGFTWLAGSLAAQPPKKKKILAIGQSIGFEHDAMSYGLGTVWKLGHDTGLWDTYLHTDTSLLTKKKLDGNRKNLDFFDAVFFYSTGELTMDEQQKADFISFIRDDGKGFIGSHCATDTFYQWAEYGEMIGAYFDLHPWHQLVKIRVEDRSHPAMKHFPADVAITDEIYQFKNYSRDKLRVLMSLDPSSVDLTKKGVHRTDQDFAVTWVKTYGKGRVFYSSLGHREEVWDRSDIQQMWLEGIKWALGMTQGEAGPRPKPK